MDEPASLIYAGREKLFVTAVGKSGNTQMKLKNKYACCYNYNTYKQLKEAFNSKDIERLEKEWYKAKPIISI